MTGQKYQCLYFTNASKLTYKFSVGDLVLLSN